MRYRYSIIGTAVTLALVFAATFPVSATTEDAISVVPPSVDSDHIIVETFDPEGNLLTSETINLQSLVFYSSNRGSGGSSSASGCNKVTVNNEKETLLGNTAYWFHTWTYWCWNRANRTVSNVNTGAYLSGVDPFFFWRGIIIDNTNYFSRYFGYSRSGYLHEKQGHFENCIVRYGCISNSYPHNLLHTYSNGTFTWQTHD